MTEILIPRPGRAPLNTEGVLMSWWDKVSYIAHSESACHEIIQYFGHPEFCPMKPILLKFPDGQHALLAGEGVTSAAEMQDLAIVTWGRYLDRVKKNGRIFDFDELRERHGIRSFEDADAEIRNRLLDYKEYKERRRRTLPGKAMA